MSHDELIQHYFEGSLDETGKELFKQQLLKDTAFAEEVAFQEKAKAALHLNERKKLKHLLQQMEQQPLPEAKMVNMPSRKWWYAAAAIMVMACSLWLMHSPNTEKLYAAYYQPYPNTVSPVVRGESGKQSDIAMKAYDNKDYTTAFRIWKEGSEAGAKQPYINLYQAICLMELNRHAEAEMMLKTVPFEYSEMAFAAKWYNALCCIKLGKPKEALPLLEAVASSQHPLQHAAQQLLKQLR